MKKPRSSRLSMTTKLTQLQRENETLREALETIADVLEDVGILGNEEEIEEFEEPEVIVVPPSPPEQNPSQHPEDDNPGD